METINFSAADWEWLNPQYISTHIAASSQLLNYIEYTTPCSSRFLFLDKIERGFVLVVHYTFKYVLWLYFTVRVNNITWGENTYAQQKQPATLWKIETKISLNLKIHFRKALTFYIETDLKIESWNNKGICYFSPKTKSVYHDFI